jgi:outer membrane protein assembly factor BamB
VIIPGRLQTSSQFSAALKAFVGLIVFVLTAHAEVPAGDTWPGWRGRTGLGLSDEKDLPLTWGGPTNENIVWKSPLPGADAKAKSDHNQSSPIVWKDRVFVVAAYWPEGVAQSEFPEHHVACYSAADGKLLWDVKVPPGPWLLKDLRGGYAAPTPCTDGERVYALFGSSELAALDFDSRLLWRKEIAPFAWDVAVGTSPVLTRDAVLVLADGTKPALSRLIAFDPATGNIKWERKRPDANFNHTTPVLIEVNGQRQLLIASSAALQGVDPVDGAVIWWATNKGDVPTPAYKDGLVYSEDGRGGPGIAVDPTGIGDVTGTRVKWTTRPIPEGYSSPTMADGYIYRTHNPGILRCIAVADGKRVFAERLPSGVNTSASPVLTADGRLYFASGGKSIVLPLGANYEPLAINDLGDGGAASPAVAHGRLYLRGSRYLYCIGKSRKSP